MSYLKTLGLTEEQLEGIFKAKIGTYAKQIEALEATIKKMGDEVTALHDRRKDANVAFESARINIEEQKKKVDEQRSSNQKERQALEKAELRIAKLREKLNLDKEVFKQERLLYRDREESLVLAEKELQKANDEIKSIQESLYEMKDAIYIREKEVSAVEKNAEAITMDAQIMLGEAREEKEKYENLNKALEKELSKYRKLVKSNDEIITTERAKYDRMRSDLNDERDSLIESFRKRDLAVSRKEKILETQMKDFRLKKEQLEILEAKMIARDSEFDDKPKKRGRKKSGE